MRKPFFIFMVIIVAIFAGFIIYKNYDEIIDYFNNKEWELTETVGTVTLGNYYTIDGTTSNLIVVGSNFISGYSSNANINFDESVSLKDPLTASNGDYCIIAENGGMKVYMINGNDKIWEMALQGTILDVSINKNGYATIIYKQSGYKSVIKVLNPEGVELFTNFLASTYAIDAEISNDNKTLAIAEINTDGTKSESSVELIDVTKQAKINKIALDDNDIVLDIEYNSKNELLVKTDNNVKIVIDNELTDFINIANNNVKIATIENANNAIVVAKEENGIFDTNYKLEIYEYKSSGADKKEYELESLPIILKAQNKNIAMLLEKEFIVVNTNGKIVKRCEVSRNVKDIVMFNNGNMAALIYRDKIEFLKV